MSDQENDLLRNLSRGQYERMNRLGTAILAKEVGLDPTEFAQPFPGNQSITINRYPNSTPEVEKKKKSALRRGLSPLAAAGIGLLGAAIPAAGIIGYMLNRAPAAVSTVEKIIEKPVEKVITLPGKSFGVDVDMEVIPPR